VRNTFVILLSENKNTSQGFFTPNVHNVLINVVMAVLLYKIFISYRINIWVEILQGEFPTDNLRKDIINTQSVRIAY
jgi:hypothetical protein